jgi:hypothetical protein
VQLAGLVISTEGCVVCGCSGETSVFAVRSAGQKQYRGFSTAQDEEACPASVEMTGCLWRLILGDAEADADDEEAVLLRSK